MEDPEMAAAVITACASVIVAVLAYLLNQHSQSRFERRQARLRRIDDQLRNLYGPLRALVGTNENIWNELRRTRLPGMEERRSDRPLAEEALAEWKHWLNGALMPINRQMRDLIIEHADLLIETEMPATLQTFCAHVASYEVLLARLGTVHAERHPLVNHPGQSFVRYVMEAFQGLKAEQERLLALSR